MLLKKIFKTLPELIQLREITPYVPFIQMHWQILFTLFSSFFIMNAKSRWLIIRWEQNNNNNNKNEINLLCYKKKMSPIQSDWRQVRRELFLWRLRYTCVRDREREILLLGMFREILYKSFLDSFRFQGFSLWDGKK